MVSLRSIPDIVKTFGWQGLLRRSQYMLLQRTGQFERKLPVLPIPTLEGFTFSYGFDLEQIDRLYQRLPEIETVRSMVQSDCARIADGNLLFFSREWKTTHWPPGWLVNYASGKAYTAEQHWTKISDLDPVFGDIKYVWEPSRFAFVYSLCRGYVLFKDQRYGAMFWQALTSWIESNPANGGPNWRCGQESSLRLMAVLFGLLVFANAQPPSPELLARVGGFLRFSGQRIAATLDYALSQRNNHAVSEVVGLWTLATLFPKWPESTGWKHLAERLLVEVLQDQFYPDGSYGQHSFNYQRLAMHNLLWLSRVAKLTGSALPDQVSTALKRSTDFLYGLQHQASGWLPNYGPNDGALILPLSTSDFRDYRPLLQTASLHITQNRLYEPGRYDEEAIWLCPDILTDAKVSPARPQNPLIAHMAGCFAFRGSDSLGFLRASTYPRHRPAQADNLHFDLWLGDTNLALDPGTFSYNNPPPWDNSLARAQVHNTATADGRDPMVRLGRFLWTEWNPAKLLAHASEPDRELWVVETALLPLSQERTLHRRAILRLGNWYLVVDRLESAQPHKLELNWNFAPLDWTTYPQSPSRTYTTPVYKIKVLAPTNATFTEKSGGDPSDTQGWQSIYYGSLTPCFSVRASVVDTRARFFTAMGYTSEHPPQKAFEEMGQQLADGLELSVNDLSKSISMILKELGGQA